MSWFEGALGFFSGMVAIATLVEWFRATWEMSVRDVRAGGFGMGRIQGERPGLLYGKAGLIDSAGSFFGFCMWAAVAFAFWTVAASSWVSIVLSLLLGLVFGASGSSRLPPEQP